MEQPSWAFVEKRYADRRYQELLDGLAAFAPIQETTDLSDDWAVVVFIGDVQRGLGLRLSLVGKYACVHDSTGTFHPRRTVRAVPYGRSTLAALDAAGVELLGPDELGQSVHLGAEEVSLYEALFSSDEVFVL